MRGLRRNKTDLIRGLPLLIIISISIASIYMATPLVKAQEVPNGPWPDEVIFDTVTSTDIGIERVIRGEVDIFLSGISDPVVAKRVVTSGLPYDTGFGLWLVIFVNYACKVNETTGEIIEPVFPNPSKNPDPSVNGKILMNPFCDRRIREALHWIIDRDYIANQIFGGLAVPRYVPIHLLSPDYGRLYDVIYDIEQTYKYNFEKGKQVIFDEMQKLGAEYRDGKWYYKGDPVIIIYPMRTEGLGRLIGEYVSSQLEKLGFQVLRFYGDPSKLTPLTYGADPYDGTFHLFTGGWLAGSSRDESGSFSFYYTPYGSSSLLWRRIINTPEFKNVVDKLRAGNYTNMEERLRLMAEALRLALKEENQEIFVVHIKTVWIRQNTVDLVKELGNPYVGVWVPYTIHRVDPATGKPIPGGTIKATIGTSIFVQPWNTIAGSGFAPDLQIIGFVQDKLFMNDPYSGLPTPIRIEKAEVYAKKGLPMIKTLDWVTLKFVDEIKVPDDAILLYDCSTQRLVTVGEAKANLSIVKQFGVDSVKDNATVKIVMYFDKYMSTGQYKWHDGTPYDISDLIYDFILAYDRACPGSPLYDESASAPIDWLRGFKIVSRNPLVVEYYTDSWSIDAESTAGWSFWAPGGMPWHVQELIAMAEREGKLAFSQNKANKLKAEWADPSKGPSIPIMLDELNKAINEKWIPYRNVLLQYISEDQALARWNNLKKWYDTYGHFFVASGLFYLYKVDPTNKIAIVRANRNYPDRADRWMFFSTPPSPQISVKAPDIITIGSSVNITLKVIKPTGEPYEDKYLEFVKYILIGSAGVKITGDARLLAPGTYSIYLSEKETSALQRGPAQLVLIAASKLIALPTLQKVSVFVEEAPKTTTQPPITSPPVTQTTATSPVATNATTAMPAVTNTTAPAGTQVNYMIAAIIAAVVIVGIIVGIFVFRRAQRS